jgi:hypothetical protein
VIEGIDALKSAPSTIGGVQFLTNQYNSSMSDIRKAKKKRKKGSKKVIDILKGGSQ